MILVLVISYISENIFYNTYYVLHMYISASNGGNLRFSSCVTRFFLTGKEGMPKCLVNSQSIEDSSNITVKMEMKL